MSRWCLDTSAYSQFKRGHAGVAALLDTADFIAVPTVVVGELWLGFLGGRRRDDNEREFEMFLACGGVEVVDVDRNIARRYAQLVFELRRIGRPLPTNDIWIAATAALVDTTVLTFDDHFRDINGVQSIVLI